MKAIQKAVLGITATLLLTTATVASAADVKNEVFSLTLPDGFTEFAKQDKTTDSENGPINTATYVSKAPTGEAVVVTVSTMPKKISDPAKFISSTRDSLINSLKAKLENEAKGSTENSSVLNFRTETAQPVFLRSSLQVSDNRFYQVLYVGRTEEQRNAAATAKLFDTFAVAAPAAAPAPVATPAPAAAPAPAATATGAAH